MARVTEKQRTVLNALDEYVDPPSARQLADRLERPRAGTLTYTYDEVYSVLRALERKALVARAARKADRATGWQLTLEGKLEVG